MNDSGAGKPTPLSARKPQTFQQFVDAHPDFSEKIRKLAHEHASSSADRLHPDLVYDLTMRDVERQWPTIRDLNAFLAFVVPRHASKLRKKKRVIKRTHSDPEVALTTSADSRETRAIDPLVTAEEEKHVVDSVAGLSKEERDVLDAFANSKSGREAARNLGISESTYRLRLRKIIEKIQPPPGLRDGD